MLKQLKGTRGCCFVSEVCPSNQTVLPVPDKREPEKFLQSMVSKSGKLRALVRDLKKSYEESAIQKFPDRNLQHDISSHKIYPNIWIYFQRSGNHDDSHFFVQWL
jgi:hypothetical protein